MNANEVSIGDAIRDLARYHGAFAVLRALTDYVRERTQHAPIVEVEWYKDFLAELEAVEEQVQS